MSPDLQRLWNHIRLAIAPVKINLVDDSQGTQTQQIDLGPQGPEGSLGIHDHVPVLLAFGIASNPPEGSDGLALHIGGDRSNAVIIGHGHQQYRLKNLQPGDAALHDVRGAYVWMTANGPVIDAAGMKVTIQNASDINITCSGTVTVTADHVTVKSDDVSLGDTGGAKVALVGDSVAGGVITGPGATKVTAV